MKKEHFKLHLRVDRSSSVAKQVIPHRQPVCFLLLFAVDFNASMPYHEG